MLEFPKNPTTSWVIRTKNEEKWLDEVLNSLFMQSRLDFEIIIVDSGSTDKTLEIFKRYPIREIIYLEPSEFNYSYALNLGIREAYGEFIGILSGHSLPIDRYWYENGIRHFKDSLVACVGGQYSSLPDGSYEEKLGDLIYFNSQKNRAGIFEWLPLDNRFEDLTNTNMIIRKELWKIYPFNEELEEAEDYDWAYEMRARGYKTIYESRFNVYHSHGGLGRDTIESRKQKWAELRSIIKRKSRPSKPKTRLKTL